MPPHVQVQEPRGYTHVILCDLYTHEWNSWVEGHMSLQTSSPLDTAYWSRKCLYQFTLTSACKGVPISPCDHKHLKLSEFLIFPGWWMWNGTSLWFSLHFSDWAYFHTLEHIFIHLLVILFCNVSFTHFSVEFFFNYWFTSHLYILDLNPLSIMYIANFFPVCSLSYHLFNDVFWCAGIFFILTMLALSAFFFMGCAFDILLYLCSNQRS